MNFLDRTGHIFDLTSYDEYPIGYEYQENPYIFWFDTERGYKLSVDNYYFKPIRIVNKLTNFNGSISNTEYHINIKLENSEKFFIIGSKVIEEQLLTKKNINETVYLDEKSLRNNELHYVLSASADDKDNDLNGVIAEEERTYITVKYYLKSNGTEVNQDELTKIEDLHEDVTTYIDFDYAEVPTEGKTGIFLVPEKIGSTTKYYEVVEKEKKIDVTHYEQNFEDSYTETEYYLINTFYVVVNSSEPGTWTTNILIEYDNEWCPITVGAEIVDEAEELMINGNNFGIRLPKEILNAVYSYGINSVVPDEKGYYLKLKEYLLNYMSIKGETGNYRSILNGLKWFEWDDKLTISKLMKNDNRIQNQYVRDFFDILNDNIYSYQLFKETSLLSMDLPLYEEGENELQNLQAFFWGEGKPKITSKISKNREIYYDEKEFPYVRGYFDYTFSDLALKLCFLKYYYEKYFLPIHIKLHNVSISQKVYANDIKLINKTSHGITASPIYISNKHNDSYYSEYETANAINESNVIFNHNNYDTIYFNREYKNNTDLNYSIQNKLYIDSDYNHFTDYTTDYVAEKEEIFYEVNDTCLRIPIDFIENKYYDVKLIFSRYVDKTKQSLYVENYDEDDNLISVKSNVYKLFETSFKFIQTEKHKYDSLILYPKKIIENHFEAFDQLYWLNNIFRIDMIVNGELYNYTFNVKMPEFNIELGTIKYRYDSNFRQIKSISDEGIKFNTYMYAPNLVNVNNYSFSEEIMELSGNLTEYVNRYYKESVKFFDKKYLNICHMFDLLDINGNVVKYNGPEESISWDVLNQFIDVNNSEEVMKMYRNFFNEDGSYTFENKLLNINKHVYDLYLMHDYSQWYVILISKEPLNDWNRNVKFKFFKNSTSIKIGDYVLKYQRSDKKFLLNRYLYIPSDGYNHFNGDDIIVASLKNNDKLSFRFSSGSKWIVEPLSLGMSGTHTISSNTELSIISISDELIEYEPGYYSITVNYAIDDFIDHSYTKQSVFVVDSINEIEHKMPDKTEMINGLPTINEILNK